jgi:hypothetical protein
MLWSIRETINLNTVWSIINLRLMSTFHRAMLAYPNEMLVTHTICWETNQYFTFGSNAFLLFQNYYVQPPLLYGFNTIRMSWQFLREIILETIQKMEILPWTNIDNLINPKKEINGMYIIYTKLYLYTYMYIGSTLLFSGCADIAQWRELVT